MGSLGKKLKRAAGEATKDRLHMLQHNAKLVAAGAQSALDSGTDLGEIVVHCIDVRDSLGAAIVKAADSTTYDQAVQIRGAVPVVVLRNGRKETASSLAESSPAVSRKLASPPPFGFFWTLCIASGGSTLTARFLEGNQDALMLAGAKQFLDGEKNVFRKAPNNILVVCDLRDPAGRRLGAALSGLAPDSPEFTQIARNFLGTPDDPNPHPFVVGWASRAGFAKLLETADIPVKSDWQAIAADAPADGSIITFLKRGGESSLLLVPTFENIPSLAAYGLALGGGSEGDGEAS